MSSEKSQYRLPPNSIEASQDIYFALDQFADAGIIQNYSKYYSLIGIKSTIIYQGDGMQDMPIVNLPEPKVGNGKVLVLSNTCDIDPSNIRKFPSHLVYAPIFSLAKYEDALRIEGEYDRNHIEAIKKQEITQIIFLPKGQGLAEDSLVFLDRICSCDREAIELNDGERLFSLSQAAFYLLTVKLGIHFTRLKEGVSRG